MPGLYSITTRADGTTLTAAIYNSDHQNHVDNHVPAQMDDISSTVAAMRSVSDPGELGSETQATSLEGELKQIRNMLQEIIGKTYWYETPATDIATLNSRSLSTTGVLAPHKNLKVTNQGTTTGDNQLNITADELLLNDGSGNFLKLSSVSISDADITTDASTTAQSGRANGHLRPNAGWSYLFVVSNGTNTYLLYDNADSSTYSNGRS